MNSKPATPASLKIQTEPFDFPRVVVKEGKINTKELQQIGRDETRIMANIRNTYKIELKDVLLATLDKNESMQIFLYK